MEALREGEEGVEVENSHLDGRFKDWVFWDDVAVVRSSVKLMLDSIPSDESTEEEDPAILSGEGDEIDCRFTNLEGDLGLDVCIP